MSLTVPFLACLLLIALWLAGRALTRLPLAASEEPAPSEPPAVGAPSASGFAALPEGQEAFAIRLALLRQAREEICAQYYLWRGDVSGSLLFAELRAAALRGVRVRLLLDDNATPGLDSRLAWLDSHPNVELRLFNPFRPRFPRLLSYLFRFARVNRRMHNKALIVDGRLAVLGGRNIGDEYFNDLSDIGLFMDMDILVGETTAQAARLSFEQYWTSEASLPATRLIAHGPRHIARGAAREQRAEARARATRFATTVERIIGNRIPGEDWAPLRPARIELLADPPQKVLGRARRQHLLYPSLRMALGTPQSDYDLITPYFVPRRRDSRQIAALARAGVHVRILTNALAASDTPIVHAGYGWKRRKLLRAGVTIYEYQGDGRLRLRRGLMSPSLRRGAVRLRRDKLHAKIFSVDRARVFIGTFNFDPRSLFLNTEMGVIVHDPDWAAKLDDGFRSLIPQSAWRVDLDGQRLHWSKQRPEGGPPETARVEPGTRWWQRALIACLSLLPIDRLL